MVSRTRLTSSVRRVHGLQRPRKSRRARFARRALPLPPPPWYQARPVLPRAGPLDGLIPRMARSTSELDHWYLRLSNIVEFGCDTNRGSD